MINSETITQVVTAYFENLQTMNPEGWLATFAENGVTYDPVGNPPSQVQEDYQKFFGILSMAFAELEIAQDQVFLVKNGAAVKWTMRGLGRNGRQGIAEGVSTFELNEAGKIKQVCSYWDDAAMMAQIKGS